MPNVAQRLTDCAICNGSGIDPSPDLYHCRRCGGTQSLEWEAAAVVLNLAALVRRLSRFAPPGPASAALDYLKRHELEGSPVRAADSADAQYKP